VWILGDRWNNYCIVRRDWEKLKEGELRMAREDLEEFLRSLAACVVMETGRHSAWARHVMVVWEHEVLVANPRKMEEPPTGLTGFAPARVPPKHSGSVVLRLPSAIASC
jgi:hypothetical protein